MRPSLFLAFAFALASGGCKESVHHPLENVSSSDVDAIEVVLENQPDASPDIGPFLVKPDDFDAVLNLFRDGSLDREPCNWQVLGYVKIRSKDGRQIMVHLYWTQQTKGAYTIDRAYRGSNDVQICSVLRDCFKHLKSE